MHAETHDGAETVTIGVFDPDDRAPSYRRATIPVAVAELVRSATWFDEDDICESALTYRWWKVTPLPGETRLADAPTIAEAFRVTLSTQGGCGHDHDCCGCRSFTTRTARRDSEDGNDGQGRDGRDEQIWETRTSSSRNY